MFLVSRLVKAIRAKLAETGIGVTVLYGKTSDESVADAMIVSGTANIVVLAMQETSTQVYKYRVACTSVAILRKVLNTYDKFDMSTVKPAVGKTPGGVPIYEFTYVYWDGGGRN